MRRLLILDDEVNVLHALQRTLRQCFPVAEMKVETFTDPENALLRTGEAAFDIVISDYRMPSMNGIDFLMAVKGIQPESVRLVLSASTEFNTVMNAINQAEVFRYIAKPWQVDEIKKTLALAFARRDKTLEDQRLADEVRAKRGELTPQELEARQLEAEDPGITKVNWGPDGSVHLD